MKNAAMSFDLRKILEAFFADRILGVFRRRTNTLQWLIVFLPSTAHRPAMPFDEYRFLKPPISGSRRTDHVSVTFKAFGS